MCQSQRKPIPPLCGRDCSYLSYAMHNSYGIIFFSNSNWLVCLTAYITPISTVHKTSSALDIGPHLLNVTFIGSGLKCYITEDVMTLFIRCWV